MSKKKKPNDAISSWSGFNYQGKSALLYVMQVINEKIREIRLSKSMKQSDLAEKSGISRVAIGNYERGDRQPNIEVLINIAEALGVGIGELIGIQREVAMQKSNIEKKMEDTKNENIVISCNHYDCCFCINDICIRKHSLKIVKGVCDSFELEED